ncbi:ribonuclease H-like domain-containing protein [Jeotgalibacillus sp. JSM ZJ347]|uniref:ribonuclease H-like domain-containing protein n=1 Tax=Jeotgalibacillus sp. JSM ZJ347 TaxID=3342117 RepID=UPI0035A8DD8E
MDLKKKLARMKPHLNQSEEKPLINAEKLPHMDIWKENHTDVFTYEDQHCLIREVHFPVNYQHGQYLLSDFLNVVEAWNRTDFNHSLSAQGYQAQDLFFFDTETTGLSGTGTSIFLLGYAKFERDKLVLKQHILTDPSNEIALYLSFLENVNYETLVTFNGKSFDWPQVQSRHTLIRNHVPKLPQTGHFDLYHAAKRIWKSSLKSLKLKSLEEEKLGFQRKDDIPGYLAPAIYFDFVERKHPEGMLKVLDHNEKDILSLITLYTHISLQLLGTDQHQNSIEKLETGKWFKKEGEYQRSEKYLKDSYEMDQNPSAAFHLAFEYKKQQQFNHAVELFNISLEKGLPKEQRISAIEISKIYEHKEKDFSGAYFYAAKAIKALDAETMKEEQKQKNLDHIKHRLNRISGKLSGNK